MQWACWRHVDRRVATLGSAARACASRNRHDACEHNGLPGLSGSFAGLLRDIADSGTFTGMFRRCVACSSCICMQSQTWCT